MVDGSLKMSFEKVRTYWEKSEKSVGNGEVEWSICVSLELWACWHRLWSKWLIRQYQIWLWLRQLRGLGWAATWRLDLISLGWSFLSKNIKSANEYQNQERPRFDISGTYWYRALTLGWETFGCSGAWITIAGLEWHLFRFFSESHDFSGNQLDLAWRWSRLRTFSNLFDLIIIQSFLLYFLITKARIQ